MKFFAAALLLAVSSAAHRSGPAEHHARQKPRLWNWLRCTYANLRRSGALDSDDELKESYLSRQLVAGRLDTAAYQLAMTELAKRASPAASGGTIGQVLVGMAPAAGGVPDDRPTGAAD